MTTEKWIFGALTTPTLVTVIIELRAAGKHYDAEAAFTVLTTKVGSEEAYKLTGEALIAAKANKKAILA